MKMHDEKTQAFCGNLESRYVTPALDENLSMTRGQDTYYYMRDGLGSVRNVVGASETVENIYDYRAFGLVITEIEGVECPYRFTAREREPGGLSHAHFYRNRYYMPGVGLFMSRDAKAYDRARGFQYVRNNPIHHTDPSGWNVENREIALDCARAKLKGTEVVNVEALIEKILDEINSNDDWLVTVMDALSDELGRRLKSKGQEIACCIWNRILGSAKTDNMGINTPCEEYWLLRDGERDWRACRTLSYRIRHLCGLCAGEEACRSLRPSLWGINLNRRMIIEETRCLLDYGE